MGLAVERISKRFGAVLAVDQVSLSFAEGQIHAVVGENGAGKTTLLKIAAGLLAPDEGRVLGTVRGVSMVQQHFSLAGGLTALDNVMLGAEPTRRFGRLDRAAARARAGEVAREMGASIRWGEPVDELGVGDRQRLEIVRALVRDARVIILDEPTAALTPGEGQTLYAMLRRLASTGRAVVIVTHRLDEVRDHADHVSIMRRGRLVASRPFSRDESSFRAMAREVMGDAEVVRPTALARPLGPVRIELRDVWRRPGLRGATLSVHGGEIVGVAGVDGNGQRELVRVLAGLEPVDAGVMRTDGVAVVHEERGALGLVLDASVRDNLVLGELATFTRAGIVDRGALEREAAARLERSGIEPRNLDAPARSLSGGNQQKLVMTRALARAPRVAGFVFAQPTRGIDAAAVAGIHEAIVRAAADGKAILVVSADLDELRTLCDRILVLGRGRITADLPPDAPDARFGDAMLGADAHSPGLATSTQGFAPSSTRPPP